MLQDYNNQEYYEIFYSHKHYGKMVKINGYGETERLAHADFNRRLNKSFSNLQKDLKDNNYVEVVVKELFSQISKKTVHLVVWKRR